MRRLLLILMIAVLPVRGWASDVMTVASAAQQLSITTSTIEFIATHALHTRARATFDGYFEEKTASSMPWDCPWRAENAENSMQDGIDTASESPSNRFCKGCNTCQLCMALATGVSLPVFNASVETYPVPPPHCSGFSSATLPPGFKPPIA
jgi:peptidoglycan hydrolase-like protein with peptidoglycan-binding domain